MEDEMHDAMDSPESPSLWRYRSDVPGDGSAVVGFDVEAIDGHIGKIDQATVDAGNSSLVVDTGFWIFGKKRRIPAGLVDRINYEEQKVFIHAAKEVVKASPEYVEDSDHPDYRDLDRYNDYYGPMTR